MSRTFEPVSRTLKFNFVLPAALILLALLAAQSAWRQSPSDVSKRHFAERVNLALRQTAHRLLIMTGDSTSAIPPVQEVEKNTWLIRLEKNFDYDSLPPVLQKAFSTHHIEGEYSVMVVDCAEGELMLGYFFNPRQPSNDIACGGREQKAGCYNLQVTFTDLAPQPFAEKRSWILFAAAFAALLAFSAYRFFIFLKKKGLTKEEPAPISSPNGQKPIQFGRSALRVDNQKLVCNGVTKDLTYRETKLLQLFCRHTNQLLERDSILKSVWEDEGIIVGRSVDVFVSRLRKLLKEDDSVKIVSVHGVGYRMEIEGH